MKRSGSIYLVVVFLFMLGVLFPRSGHAQQEQPVSDDQVNAIAKQLYCPVCENIPLDVCGTQACAQWRELIRDKLGQGWTEAQIKQYFADQYGDRVLAQPPAEGLNWLVYLVPPLAFIAGVFILIKAFRSWKTPSASPPANAAVPPPANQDEYISRLEEELRRSD